jgi:hypothetical protein
MKHGDSDALGRFRMFARAAIRCFCGCLRPEKPPLVWPTGDLMKEGWGYIEGAPSNLSVNKNYFSGHCR